jgi:diapolycopene oxygenase
MKKFKVTVLGGGLGGMSAAISLAAQPQFEVTLVEKNSHLGGKLNVMVKDGFSFDLGPSILTMPHIFENLFVMHGKSMADHVKIVKVSPHWRNVFEDGTIIDLEDEISKMRPSDRLSEEDIEDLKRFYAYTERIYNFTDKTYFQNEIESALGSLKHYPWHRILPDSDYFRTMDQAVRAHIKNPYLVDVMNYFIKYVGSSPYDAPAILNVLPYVQWAFGLWYVDGGMFNLSKGLSKLIESTDIRVMTGKEVNGITKDGDTITGVVLEDGTVVKTDILVSNMEVIPFYERISKEDPKRIRPYKEKYGPACSGFALHLGVDRTYDMLRHHNFFHSDDPKLNFDNIFHKHKLSKDPTIYLVAPMKTDKTLGPKGTEIIKILPHIPVIDPDNPFTEEDYATYKDNVLTKLERMGLTDLRKHIVTEELWVPETIEEMYFSNQGSIYGVVSDKALNKGFKTPKKSPFYDNLYFVGGSVNPGGGMPMVALSGQQAAKRIASDRRYKAR